MPYKNREDKKEQDKKYYIKNRENLLKQHKQWYENNRERKNRHKKYKRKTDLKFNLNEKISHAINFSLKGNKNGRHWETLVNYTLDDLIKRLKKTMPKGYTWQDYLEGKLHLDHIIPISAHNFTTSKHIDFKRCWSLSNLQLLPAKENLAKHDKLYKPFQPTLKISLRWGYDKN